MLVIRIFSSVQTALLALQHGILCSSEKKKLCCYFVPPCDIESMNSQPDLCHSFYGYICFGNVCAHGSVAGSQTRGSVYNFVASELKDPICHSNECQIGSFSSEATICIHAEWCILYSNRNIIVLIFTMFFFSADTRC